MVSRVPGSLDEAEKAGGKRIEQPENWHPDGVVIEGLLRGGGGLIYVGPCENHYRTICYEVPAGGGGGTACFSVECGQREV